MKRLARTPTRRLSLWSWCGFTGAVWLFLTRGWTHSVGSAVDLTIVLVVCNQAGVVSETLRSILAQSFRDFAVLIVDDGSTDTTPAVVQDFISDQVSAGDRRFLYKRINHSGLAHARNYGLSLVQSTWVFLLDGDDLIHPNLLGSSVSVTLKEDGINLVVADLKGFGDFPYVWRIPRFSGRKLLENNVFHVR